MAIPKVNLQTIADSIEASSNEIIHYLDRQTGEVVMTSDEDREAAEDGEPDADAPDWQKEAFEQTRLILEDDSGRFLELPTQHDANEWRMMAAFTDAVQNPDHQGWLNDAIHGAGAYRRFKDAAHRLGIIEQWYEFKSGRYLKLAREWCEENEIEFEEGDRRKARGRDAEA